MKRLSSTLHKTQLFLLHLAFLLTPFVFTWVNNELFEFNKMLAIYGFAFTIIGMWLARMIAEKKIIWKKHPLNWLILLFLGGQLLSFGFSMHSLSSWWGYPSRLNGGILSSLVFVGMYFAILNAVSKKQAKQLLLTNIIALVLVAIYAIPEHFGASPSCLLINKEWGVSCWKQDVQARVFASFGQPNWLASYLVTLSPLAWWLTFKAKSKKYRLTFGVISLLAFLSLWYTGSKSGLLAYGIAALVFYGTLGWRWLKSKKEMPVISVKAHIGLALGTIVLASFLSWKFLIKPTYLAGTSQTSQESFDLSKGSSSANIRKIVWYGAWKVWQRYPIVGSGPATFAYSYYQDRPIAHNLVSEWDFIYNKAHNEFLNYLAETGLIGLMSYLVFIGGSIWIIIKQKNNQLLNLAIVSGLIGMHLSNFFGFSTAMTNLLLFSLPSLAAVISDNSSTIKKSIKLNQYLQKILLIGVLLLWYFSTLFLIKTWLGDYRNTQGTVLISRSQYTDGLTEQQAAIKLSPRRGEYYESLANTYAKLALIYYYDEQKNISRSLYEAALANSDYALALNPHHLNFYKTKVRTLLLLSEFDENNLKTAEQTLLTAIKISPTDAKLWYNLGIALAEQKKTVEAIKILEETVSIKPDYIKAREKLGDYYLEINEFDKAKEQYGFILEKLSSTNVEVRQKLEKLNNESISK